ncbi:aminoglycoside phosphotransferase (APT) family kinase protein [Mycobacterium sp. URHB0021]
MDRQRSAAQEGERLQELPVRRHQNVIYQIRRGEGSACSGCHRPKLRPTATRASREWRIIEALDGTEVPHTKAVGACPDASVPGTPYNLMGFVDGWSPLDQGTRPGPFDSDPIATGLADQWATDARVARPYASTQRGDDGDHLEVTGL